MYYLNVTFISGYLFLKVQMDLTPARSVITAQEHEPSTLWYGTLT